MTESLFDLVGSTHIPALDTFVASSTFRPQEVVDGVNITWIGQHFREFLLPLREAPASPRTLREHCLRIDARDTRERGRFLNRPGVVDELGGRDKIVIRLAQFWHSLTHADTTRCYAGYVIGKGGVLYGVHAAWLRGGVHIESGDFERPYRWGAGCIFLVP
jgi:hypothetical protein